MNAKGTAPGTIYILLSIKTRIETLSVPSQSQLDQRFISYYPLKQGLKLDVNDLSDSNRGIYILLSIKTRIETYITNCDSHIRFLIYILLSIKTRIETLNQFQDPLSWHPFISYYPLKQGLKQKGIGYFVYRIFRFYSTIH